MDCAQCHEIIDDDSHYCDQCGAEVRICAGCGKPGKGKRCTGCGGHVLPARERANTGAPPAAAPQPAMQPATAPVLAARPITAAVPGAVADNISGATRRLPDAAPASTPAPELRLLNRNIQADIRIEHDTLIGRTTGPHVAIFSRFDQVSSRHCRFSFEAGRGWYVTDLGSTNKTLYNNQVLTPQTPQLLADQGYLKIANIEFFVQLTST